MTLKKILSLLVAVTMLFSCVGITAMAEESYVATIGETGYATLAEAVSVASSGDTIVLNADIETLPVIDKAITIDGANHNVAATAGENQFGTIDGTVTIKNVVFTNGNEAIRTDYLSADYTNLELVLEGCTFNNLTTYAIMGGKTDPDNHLLKKLVVKSCTFNTSGTNLNYMLYAQCVGELVVENCIFNGSDTTKGAIHTGDSTECATVATITGGSINGVARGIQVGNRVEGSKVAVSGVSFTNVTTAADDKSGAIYIHGNADADAEVSVTDCTMTSCTNAVYNDGNTEDGDAITSIITTFTGNTADEKELVMDSTTGEVKTGGEEETATATIDSSLINVVDPEKTFISAEIKGLDKAPATTSVVIKTYSAETLVATTTLENESYFSTSPLGVKICLTAESSSWETVWEAGMPRADVVPDKNVLYVDGNAVSEAEVCMFTTNGETAIVWGEVYGVNPAPVADAAVKIGEVGYATLAEALTAASAMTGDVTVEIYDKVTLAQDLSGSYDSITFVGKDTDAEIYLEVQGYITASGENVAFEDLILSKSTGGYITNAGFMNVAFGVYQADTVSYTNCTFTNGAYASSGTNTFTNCTFYKSHDKYGLWAYGDADIVVDKCTFADYRGIKMYAEGAAKTTVLTVKNTSFSAVTDKPAIVLTYGESVTLEGNTYSSTGVFELDLDGAPNGTAVTSTDAITCKNDNGACGVLVDGKIYTTVAQAAEVATEGSTVTLLHSSTEIVELAEGVTLDKNGYTADGVTVKAPDTKVNTGYISASYTSGVSAVFGEATNVVATESFEVKLYSDETLVGTATLNDLEKELLDGKKRSITWHAALNNDGDSWWSTQWENDALNVNAIPNKAKLYVDGVLVDEDEVQLNINDLEKPVFAAVTDADGNVLSFVAGTGYLNVSSGANAPKYDDALKATLNAGGNIVMLRDVALTGDIKITGKSFTLDGNGHSITNGGLWLESGTCDVKNVVFDSINVTTAGQYGVLEFDYAKANVTGCTFINNNAKNCIAVDTNAGDNGDSVVTIDDCTFSGNTCSTAVINSADGATNVKNSAITGNTASIAVIYNSANCSVIGNVFSKNTLNGTDANKATILSGPYVAGEYEVSINKNAFLDDVYTAVYVEDWTEKYGASSTNDLSGNYWIDGDAPVAGKDYIAVNSEAVTLDSYYSTYNEDGSLDNLVSLKEKVAQIGDVKYDTLAEALADAKDNETVTLIWEDGDAPIAMNGSVYGYKTVTITGTATVDWSKGFLFVGRGGEGNGTLIFDNANLTSASDSASTGIHVSGHEKDETEKNDGTLIIKNSTIELDYLINKKDMTLDNSTLTVKNGFSVGGRPASETEDGIDATATLNLTNSSKVIVNNHNGMGLGYEAIGIMNVTEGSTFECTENFLITEKGKMNVDGGNLIVRKNITTNKNLFISGNSTVKIEELNGRATIMDETTLTDSYIKSPTNGTTRVLGDLTLVGGYETAYLMTAGSSTETAGYDGTITIKDGAEVKVSYGVEMNGNVTLNGGTIELSGGNKDGAVWGCVFQNGAFEINSDVIVDGNGDTAPIHFTNATATVNGSITQSKTDGEPIYVKTDSTVTFGDDAVITTDCSVHVNGTLKSTGDVFGTITKAADAAVIEISGGTYSAQPGYLVDGYVAIMNLDGNYVVGKAPTATVTNEGAIVVPGDGYTVYNNFGDSTSSSNDANMPLPFVMQYVADETAEEGAASPYADWYGDFVITITGLSSNSFKGTGCYLAGHYGSFGWVKVPIDNLTIENGVRYPVMLSTIGNGQKYEYICGGVDTFKCALYLTPEVLAANPDLKVDLELCVVDNSQGGAAAQQALATADSPYTYQSAVKTFEDDEFVIKAASITAAEGVVTEYATLKEAIAAADGGDTVTLLMDIVVEEQIEIKKSITLDLNEKTISSSGAIYRPIKITGSNTDITVKVTNGTITVSDVTTKPEQSAALLVYDGADVTLEDVTINGSNYGVMLAGYDQYSNGVLNNNVTSLYVNNGTAITAGSSAIIAQGAYPNTYIVINDGAAVTSNDSVAIYYPHKGALIVNGGTITGDTGICIKAGSLTVSGGTITAIGAGKEHEFVSSGAVSTGDAIVVESLNYGYYGAPTVSITGGTITSAKGKAVVSYAEEGYEVVTDFITGGTFSSDVTELCAEGFTAVQNEDGTYGIEEVELFGFYGMNLDLESSMKANFYILSSYFEGEDYYAKIVHSSATGDIETIVDFADWKNNGSYKQITYTELAAKNMADTVTVTIYDGNDKKVSVDYVRSIKTYAEDYIKAMAGTGDKWVTPFVDMLNYGAAAQEYFSYNTENLANADIEKYQSYATQSDVGLSADLETSPENIYGANLDLENRIVYNGYFSNVTDGMTAKVSYTDHLDNVVEYSAALVKNGSYHQVSVDSLVIADAKQLVTITVYDANNNVHAFRKESINGYLYRAIQGIPAFESLGKAMAKFTASAYTALHTK